MTTVGRHCAKFWDNVLADALDELELPDGGEPQSIAML
jgi:hypothetical protein